MKGQLSNEEYPNAQLTNSIPQKTITRLISAVVSGKKEPKLEGIKIPVTKDAIYTGKKDVFWTEEKTGEKTLSEDTIFVHKSHKKIEAFKSGIRSAVYDENDSEKQLKSISYKEAKEFEVIEDFTHLVRDDIAPEYVYTFKVPKGTFLEEYENEYRLDITPDIEVRLIGIMGSIRVKDDSKETRIYGGHTINVFTKKY